MIIKKATKEDLHLVAELFDLYRVFYDQQSDLNAATSFIEERLHLLDSVIFVAIDTNGVATGFTQLYPSFTSVGMQKIWILNDLYVHHNYRRKGIAKKIMDTAVSFAKKSKRSKLLLETGMDNLPAQELYLSKGWKKENSFIYSLEV